MMSLSHADRVIGKWSECMAIIIIVGWRCWHVCFYICTMCNLWKMYICEKMYICAKCIFTQRVILQKSALLLTLLCRAGRMACREVEPIELSHADGALPTSPRTHFSFSISDISSKTITIELCAQCWLNHKRLLLCQHRREPTFRREFQYLISLATEVYRPVGTIE